MVEGSGVTVLQAGLQSWQTSIQLKPGLSFYLLTFKKKKYNIIDMQEFSIIIYKTSDFSSKPDRVFEF